MSTRKGISGHFHDSFHEIPLHEVHPMIRGTVSSLSLDTLVGILHYQVAATPPETMQATMPDGAEHEVSIVHCVSTAITRPWG